jgi:hypothetical protein
VLKYPGSAATTPSPWQAPNQKHIAQQRPVVSVTGGHWWSGGSLLVCGTTLGYLQHFSVLPEVAEVARHPTCCGCNARVTPRMPHRDNLTSFGGIRYTPVDTACTLDVQSFQPVPTCRPSTSGRRGHFAAAQMYRHIPPSPKPLEGVTFAQVLVSKTATQRC